MTCSAPDCTRPRKAKGLCATHYARQRRHGDTSTVKPAGRPRQAHRARLETIMGEDFGSRRTFERFHRGFRILHVLQAYDLITVEQKNEYLATAITEATRPNGTFNVSRFLNVIETRAAPLMGWE